MFFENFSKYLQTLYFSGTNYHKFEKKYRMCSYVKNCKLVRAILRSETGLQNVELIIEKLSEIL